jgi:hypothetical protein
MPCPIAAGVKRSAIKASGLLYRSAVGGVLDHPGFLLIGIKISANFFEL